MMLNAVAKNYTATQSTTKAARRLSRGSSEYQCAGCRVTFTLLQVQLIFKMQALPQNH